MRKLPNVFNREQITQLLNTIDEPWVMIAVLLGLFCGLRRMEVQSLKVEHVDLVTKRMRVENSKNPNKTIEGYGTDRVVPIPQFMVPVVEQWIQLIHRREYMFPSIENPEQPISKEHLWRVYTRALERAGLNSVVKTDTRGLKRHKYNFHTLRHTYATLLWEKTGKTTKMMSKELTCKTWDFMQHSGCLDCVCKMQTHMLNFKKKSEIMKLLIKYGAPYSYTSKLN